MKRVIVIGAGVGGLTTAALLAQAGHDVTVLEQHIYPGGCAGTFYHQGYRFDAGATLAGGFYPGGPLDLIGGQLGIDDWPVTHDPLTMRVHLPDGSTVNRWSDERRHAVRLEHFGEAGRDFFEWQEQTADALWSLALRNPPWPPQTPGDAAHLLGAGTDWLLEDLRRLSPSLLLDLLRPVAARLSLAPDNLRAFVDAQLLIAAQTTSQHTYALYGAAALDLPRRGVAHVRGGIGSIAEKLAAALEKHGGRVLYRHPVTRILIENRRPVGVEVTGRRSGRIERLDADVVIANLPPWNVAALLGDAAPPRLKQLPDRPADGWGAITVYVGLDASVLPADFPLHHQIVTQRNPDRFGDGNTVFLSISPAWDDSRAPDGKRALTLSTHTELTPWWDLYASDRAAYEHRKQTLTDTLLRHAEQAVPALREATDLILPGTPVTFQRFTHRAGGWVGGFPQTHPFRAWGPRLMRGLWLVGDSIFPGQSIPAVALGGLRVAESIRRELEDRSGLTHDDSGPGIYRRLRDLFALPPTGM